MPTKSQIKNVVNVLNKARSMELYGIVQYMNQHYGLGGDDYEKLASVLKKIAKDEMKHAEAFAERIKDIDNALEPTTQLSDKLTTGQEVTEIFGFNAALEEDTIEKYGEFAKICRENHDPVSAVLFETISVAEQEHMNFFADTAEHIKNLGNSFLARQTGE
jgi:bacterioferritin